MHTGIRQSTPLIRGRGRTDARALSNLEQSLWVEQSARRSTGGLVRGGTSDTSDTSSMRVFWGVLVRRDLRIPFALLCPFHSRTLEEVSEVSERFDRKELTEDTSRIKVP